MFVFSLTVSHNFFRVGRFTRVEKNSWMIVSVELWIAVSAPTCEPLRLTWDVITYRFARSIVTKLHKIFEYIYHFPFHVSLDAQTTQMFCCSHHAVTTTTTIEDEERWSFEYQSRALRLRGVAGETTWEGSYITYREYNLLYGLETIFLWLISTRGA